jgi:putative transcriptional regulator
MEKKKTLGQELIEGLQEALEFEQGKRKLRTTTIELCEPAGRWKKDEIAALRKKVYKVSQPIFASMLSVKTSTVRAWEQGQKSPSGAACRLLEVAAQEPKVFTRIVHSHGRAS